MHRMRHGSLIIGLFIGIVLSSRPTAAQYTADFQTNILSGVVSNWSGNYLVGNTNFADVLQIQDNAMLFSGSGYLGYEASSSNNSALVTGSGSVWGNAFGLLVGRFGAGNSLMISDGGRVFSGYTQLFNGSGCVGYNSSSSGNSVLVTGSGSVWSNGSTLVIGGSGNGNSLVISNGGRVISSQNPVAGISGIVGSGSGSSNNNVLVAGTGSVWSNAGDLFIGDSGNGNSLVISNGGQVTDNSGAVGVNPGSTNNSVLVTGTGSAWSNSSRLYIGYSGAGNSLVISNGGLVIVNPSAPLGNSGSGFLGFNSSSSNNSVIVTGNGSVWSNRSLIVGQSGASNSLAIRDGGKVSNNSGAIGFGSSSNLVLVTGTGSVWNCGLTLFIGGGRGNSLIISNGGQVINTTTSIGGPTGSSGNSVLVTDGGTWRNMSLIIDNHSNSVVIQSGSLSATNILVGAPTSLCDNLLQLDSGSVIVTNAAGSAVFEVRRGKLILNGGTLQVDRFVMTNSCAQFVRTGGTLIYGTAVLDPNRDDDGDGMPNGYEQSHGLDPLKADADMDDDGDGMSNLQEYLAGTDPTNSASAFRIVEIAPLDEDMLLTWTTVGGKKYAVQTVAGVYTNDFIELAPVIIAPGTGESMLSVIHLGGAVNVPSRFYRVRLVP